MSGKRTPDQASWTNPASSSCLYSMSWTCSPDKLADVNSLDTIQGPDLMLNAAAAAGL